MIDGREEKNIAIRVWHFLLRDLSIENYSIEKFWSKELKHTNEDGEEREETDRQSAEERDPSCLRSLGQISFYAADSLVGLAAPTTWFLQQCPSNQVDGDSSDSQTSEIIVEELMTGLQRDCQHFVLFHTLVINMSSLTNSCNVDAAAKAITQLFVDDFFNTEKTEP
jgi:hypothetical protein